MLIPKFSAKLQTAFSNRIKQLYGWWQPVRYQPDLPNVPHYGGGHTPHTRHQPAVIATEYPADQTLQTAHLPNHATLYELQPLVWSPAAHMLYGVLAQVFHKQPYRAVYHLALTDIISVTAGLDASLHQQALARIQRKWLDFVIMQTVSGQPIGVIQLKSSNPNVAAQMQTRFIQQLCQDLDLPMLQLPIQAKYSAYVIQELIKRQLGITLVKHCPNCGAALHKHTVKKGKYAGRVVLLCSRYPECKAVQLN